MIIKLHESGTLSILGLISEHIKALTEMQFF